MTRLLPLPLAALALLALIQPALAQSPGLSPAEISQLKQRFAGGVIRWGGDAEGGAPYQLRDPDDLERVIGFEVEIIDSLCHTLSRLLGQEIKQEFVQYEWASLPLGLTETKEFDIAASGLEMTPENRQIFRMTRPYYEYALQLVTRRSDPSQIASLQDCLEKFVGTLEGSAAERELQDAGLPRGNIVAFSGQVEPFLDLELGRLDAVLLDTPIVTYYGATKPGLRVTGEPFANGQYALALRKDEAALGKAIDLALGEMLVDGSLQKIFRRWHLWNHEQAKLAGAPGTEPLPAGVDRVAELKGLGFDSQGQPDATAITTVKEVDVNIIAASAKQWKFADYAPVLVGASFTTIGLTIASMSLAVVLGLFVATCRLYGPLPVRWAAMGFIEFFRGVPLLLVLFFLYFGLGAYGLQMPAVMTAIVGFGLNYAAYEAEIYRSAILSVPRGQWEAARSLGMGEPLAFRRIILPQAIRTALGPMTNDFVALFKDTSLVSVIAVNELTKEYLILSRSSLKFVELGLLTAALYLAMSLPLGYLSRWLEKRWGHSH